MKHSSFSLPPEWAPQTSVWIGWPSDLVNWPHDLEGARDEIAALAAALAPHVMVNLVAATPEALQAAQNTCPAPIRTHLLPMGDIWLRDTGPVFSHMDGALLGLTFSFNGWGGRYILDGDTQTADAILGVTGHAGRRHDFILEGGSIDHNGAGTLLTTRQCLLNPNRNKGWTQARGEAALKVAFGASRVVWLGDGLAGDHTDGHVDNIARFIGKNRVICQHANGPDDPNSAVYAQIQADLAAAGLDVVTIPSPGRVLDGEGEVAAASHMNFIFANKLVVMPVYDTETGETARAALAQLLPGHTVIGLPSIHVLSGGGSFHCISQQVPALPQTKDQTLCANPKQR